jgi:hypothetical protein
MFPTKGLIMLLTMINKEKAPAPIERLQPNSFKRATKKTEKEYQTPYTRARVTKQKPTINQRKLKGLGSFMEVWFAL